VTLSQSPRRDRRARAPALAPRPQLYHHDCVTVGGVTAKVSDEVVQEAVAVGRERRRARELEEAVMAHTSAAVARLIRAATEHLMYQPMVQILELSYGPLVALPGILARVGRVREAYIYGSLGSPIRRRGRFGAAGPRLTAGGVALSARDDCGGPGAAPCKW
jgi:hypothetical protein